MIIRKWDHKKRKYEDHIVPDDWKIAIFRSEMSDIVQCAHCGKPLPYGDCYTSRELHTWKGMGFAVCEECYEAEWKRAKEGRKEKS